MQFEHATGVPGVLSLQDTSDGECLTDGQSFRQHASAPETEGAGIGVLTRAAMSRTAFCTVRHFFALVVLTYGRPGGRGRKARRCSSGTPTPVSVAHPIGVGEAVQNRN